MNDGMNVAGPSNDDYQTPDWLFRALDSEFGFTFDAAASAATSLCAQFSDNIDSYMALCVDEERYFCNPPYSAIDKFVVYALESSGLWVLLLPNRTDTDWFRKLVESPRVELRWFRKRIRFHVGGKEADSPRFGSVVAIVRPPL